AFSTARLRWKDLEATWMQHGGPNGPHPGSGSWACTALKQPKPPPRGLVDALIAREIERMSQEERQDHAAMARHKARWEAMRAALAEGLSHEGARAAASTTLFGSDAAGEPRTVRESYEIINDAGGKHASLTT